MKTIGICFGTATMQVVEIICSGDRKTVSMHRRIVHEGDPAGALRSFLESHPIATYDRIAVTGREFRHSVALSSISEPQAVETALTALYPEGDFPDAVVSSGAETQLVYRLTKGGGVGSVYSGNKCASGSGEFFLQQIGRIGVSLEEAGRLAASGVAYKIAGRCSVFCKSDCTHAMNKGEPKANIIAGLCRMMADKIVDLIKDKSIRRLAVIGGGSANATMVAMLGDHFDTVTIPEHAACFEAFGAALWATENECLPLADDPSKLITVRPKSFGTHPPLVDALDLVEFRPSFRGTPVNGDQCILGLDVGSTTTKAVLLRTADSAIVASVYLRTDGDPIAAARNCYRSIREQLGAFTVSIEGIGVTGSGRQIAALHALTPGVVNEIIAHATAAAHFSGDVDTIFEIGGQDAKYTVLTAGIPSDYAMNEACSAGTGSFLEEAARESLNVPTESIGEFALLGREPPDFTDQCAAFIGSDIKLAGQEGVGRDDILAGLVYSICLNFLNRVKGARPVGNTIFMQGGVCYNRAVPLAMASLMQTKIIVPPDPGLMGAFGVALEIANRMERREIASGSYDLTTLIERDAVREEGFVCAGGSEKCDRKCVIARLRLDGKVYPFGGMCNRYYNMRINRKVDTGALDLVAVRQRMLFSDFGIAALPAGEKPPEGVRTVGLPRSFLIHSLYPLFSNFFDRMGFRLRFPDTIDSAGIGRTEAAFCLPAEIAHGSFSSLLSLQPDYIFLPQVMQIPVPNVPTYSRTCVFVQGEPYYMATTFREEIQASGTVMLSPVLRMDTSYEAAESSMMAVAASMGVKEKIATEAFAFACARQKDYEKELLAVGTKTLESIDDRTPAVVLFGRPYNSFTGDANMGIPHKIASRGTMVIPHDMLPAAEYPVDKKMFWAMGQKIMKAAQFVSERQNLFGCYITNFSCGPDSFQIGYFRRVMGSKPSLTLELDQHTADAGIDTRIEAALDIMGSYLHRALTPIKPKPFKAARVVFDQSIQVVSSHGRKLPITHPDVEVLLPSMGRYGTESMAAVMRSAGINAKALPISDKEVLREGKSCTSCKECLPYILTTGSFMKYIRNRKDTWKVTLFFLPTGGGPCRLGQYCVALDQLIERQQLENAAVLTLTDENGYGGLGTRVQLRAWQAIVVSDVMGDIRSTLSVAAKNREEAFATLESIWQELLTWFEGKLSLRISSIIAMVAHRLRQIPLRTNPSTLPVVSLIGEIYVRRDEFSRKNIIDYLEQHGFMVKTAPIAEYLCYGNYVINTGLGERQFTLKEKMRMQLVARLQEWWESRIKTLFAQSGLYHFEMIDVAETIDGVKHLLNENFRGETILTVGLGMREILNDSCGIVSIGPFGCMPSRMAESMLKKELTPQGKARMPGWGKRALRYTDAGAFPFLSLETDGSPFPPLVLANLEAFILQAKRLHSRMEEVRTSRVKRKIWRHLPVTLYELVLGNGKVARPKAQRTG